MLLQFREGVARPFGLDLGSCLVGLRVLRAMTLEARNGQAQKRWRTVLSNVADGMVDQRRCLGRLGAVAVEDRKAGEARKIGRNVLSRGLIFRWHRDSVA